MVSGDCALHHYTLVVNDAIPSEEITDQWLYQTLMFWDYLKVHWNVGFNGINTQLSYCSLIFLKNLEWYWRILLLTRERMKLPWKKQLALAWYVITFSFVKWNFWKVSLALGVGNFLNLQHPVFFIRTKCIFSSLAKASLIIIFSIDIETND